MLGKVRLGLVRLVWFGLVWFAGRLGLGAYGNRMVTSSYLVPICAAR